VVDLKEISRIGLSITTRLSIKSFKKSRRKNHGKITSSHRWHSCISTCLCAWQFRPWLDSCLPMDYVHPIHVMKYQADYNRGFDAEDRFATEYLSNSIKATKEQDIFEHWDIKGLLHGSEYKFDVKALRKINRQDDSFQDDMTWVEGVNVLGNKGWLQGHADYIVFERYNEWWVVDREKLFTWTTDKLIKNGYKKGKEPYSIYQRHGRKDKITLIKYEDIPQEYIIKLTRGRSPSY
jgi:hypothetical protein